MNPVIETDKLTKRYRNGAGCFDIDLKVPGGSVFGLLGPNGAGKSSLVKTLVGLLKPSSGRAAVLGRPLGDIRVRSKIGYLPETFRYQPWMTGNELLHFHARLRRVPTDVAAKRIPELLSMVKLIGKAERPIKSYSKGMQQRIGLAAALISDPLLIFLDEPTSALDPVGRRETRELILELKKQGRTVFLNSHMLGEVELVCDQIAVLSEGHLLTMGSLDQLKGLQVVLDIRVRLVSEGLIGALSQVASEISHDGDKLSLVLKETSLIPEVAKIVAQSGAELYELVPRTRDLEQLFIDLVQKVPSGEQAFPFCTGTGQ